MAGNSELFEKEYPVRGFSYEFCGSFEDAVRLKYWEYELILLDIRFEGLGDDHGLLILKNIRERAPGLPVVMLSSRTGSDILIRCWDAGAQGYIVKWNLNPSFHRDLEVKIRRFARYRPPQAIIGHSRKIDELRATIRTLAEYDISVLITGETGTGKELVARELHDQGKRTGKPFIAVNSGAIPPTLIESELFGHVKGAFTGASDRRGKVEEADGGTLFLDEIGDLPLDMQVKLLRLLDSGEFVRVGENTPRRADIRVIAASNKDLASAVRDKLFREDLFFRISGFKINVPSLREHLDDITVLAEHFFELFKNSHPGKNAIASFSIGCIRAMQIYSWPGNVRELRNVVERAVILCRGETIGLECLPPEIAGVPSGDSILPGGRNEEGVIQVSSLPDDPSSWSRRRLVAELRLALEAKSRVQAYKRKNWKAEFMRQMYPECKAANAKGFNDLVRRLTKGPWGDPDWMQNEELRALLEDLAG